MNETASGFRLVITRTPEEAAVRAARVIRDYIETTEAPVLGLATGRTMIPVYRWLVTWHREDGLSFADATSFNLDEYCGIAATHPSSFAGYMREHLFDHVDMRPDRWFMPDPARFASDGAAYDDLIRRHGGIGLQLLGLGHNGHIGFNEPGVAASSRTHTVDLTVSTRTANARDFPSGEDVPAQAVTMGIATILDAREIVLVATGAAKAEAVRNMVHGPVTSQCPGSFLQRHDHVTIVCDREAAASM